MDQIKKIIEKFENFLDCEVRIEGRISSIRRMKNFIFVDLFWKNNKIQLLIMKELGKDLVGGDLLSVKGTCIYTNSMEKSIKVENFKIINKWHAVQGYKTLTFKKKTTPLVAFKEESYERHYIPYAIRNGFRSFLNSKGYLEVQTPVYCKKYNGGRSFPVKSSYLNNHIAFNRGTMEERMQALVGVGFEKIYQLGSVFRSDKEYTFLEGYHRDLNWKDGQNLIRKSLQSVVTQIIECKPHLKNNLTDDIIQNRWIVIDFTEAAVELFGKNILDHIDDTKKLSAYLIKKKIIKNDYKSTESLADSISNMIADQYNTLTIINGFPMWNSPLYKPYKVGEHECIQRSKFFFPGQAGGFDAGVQENDLFRFQKRLKKQRKNWGLKKTDIRVNDSDLEKVLSGGMPPMFGFGINPDRICRIWDDGFNIDPFL
jgi:lysyl-tRNA synthetase class II